MSIHPKYADAILEGWKQVEFRKRPLAPDVSTAVIYATSPTKRILGEFTIDRTLLSTPRELWESVGRVGGIDVDSYMAYYAGNDSAAGILVSVARRYPRPVALAELDPAPAVPQSFTYISQAQLDRIRGLGGDVRPLLSRVLSQFAALVRRALPEGTAATTVISLPPPEAHDDQPIALTR
jgi:predicted transcriptional regulator